MNKIYEVFDNIKLNQTIKKDIYNRVKIKLKRKNKIKILTLKYSSLILIIVISFILFNGRNNKNNFNSKDLINNQHNIMSVQDDKFIYKNKIYILQLEKAYNNIVVKDKIGNLNQIESNDILSKNFDSYYHNNYSVYSTNYKDILIVKSDIETFIYKIEK